jgi:hypothetical protein
VSTSKIYGRSSVDSHDLFADDVVNALLAVADDNGTISNRSATAGAAGVLPLPISPAIEILVCIGVCTSIRDSMVGIVTLMPKDGSGAQQ